MESNVTRSLATFRTLCIAPSLWKRFATACMSGTTTIPFFYQKGCGSVVTRGSLMGQGTTCSALDAVEGGVGPGDWLPIDRPPRVPVSTQDSNRDTATRAGGGDIIDQRRTDKAWSAKSKFSGVVSHGTNSHDFGIGAKRPHVYEPVHAVVSSRRCGCRTVHATVQPLGDFGSLQSVTSFRMAQVVPHASGVAGPGSSEKRNVGRASDEPVHGMGIRTGMRGQHRAVSGANCPHRWKPHHRHPKRDSRRWFPS